MGRRVEVLHIVGGALLLTMLTTIGTTTMLLGHGHTIDDQGQGQGQLDKSTRTIGLQYRQQQLGTGNKPTGSNSFHFVVSSGRCEVSLSLQCASL